MFSLQTESEDEEGVSLEVKMVETSMKTRGWGHHGYSSYSVTTQEQITSKDMDSSIYLTVKPD